MNSSQNSIYIKGDTIEMQFQLYKNKSIGEYWNLLNHQIRCQLNTPTKIYKATSNVVNGSDEQISLVDAVKGIFLITITCTESANIKPGNYTYEIQVTTPDNKKYTVLQSVIGIQDEFITWEEKP